jgi:hypothetical protein
MPITSDIENSFYFDWKWVRKFHYKNKHGWCGACNHAIFGFGGVKRCLYCGSEKVTNEAHISGHHTCYCKRCWVIHYKGTYYIPTNDVVVHG